MRLPALLSACLLLLGGCAGVNNFTGVRDPHAPKTVWADEEGGAVTVKHGEPPARAARHRSGERL